MQLQIYFIALCEVFIYRSHALATVGEGSIDQISTSITFGMRGSCRDRNRREDIWLRS